jgi:hypothetical protein
MYNLDFNSKKGNKKIELVIYVNYKHILLYN